MFQSVIVWIMIATISIPLLASAIQTTIEHPLAIFEFSTHRKFTANPPNKCKLTMIHILVFCGYLVVPSLLIINEEKAKLKRQTLLEQGKKEFETQEGNLEEETLEELAQIESYLDEVRSAFLMFKRNEMALELVPQQSVQLLMLFLSQTKYPTVTGLQAVFGRDFSEQTSFLENLELDWDFGTVFLVASVLWSFKTGCLSFIKIRSEQKSNSLSLAAKITLGL